MGILHHIELGLGFGEDLFPGEGSHVFIKLVGHGGHFQIKLCYLGSIKSSHD